MPRTPSVSKITRGAPLFLFNQFGDLERVMLRRGNHSSAKFWRRVLSPVIERYRGRDIGHPKLSCRRCKDNETRLQLFDLAYNLANFLRQLVLPKPIQGWTLTTLREKLVKIGAKAVSHARYRVFQLAEVAVSR